MINRNNVPHKIQFELLQRHRHNLNQGNIIVMKKVLEQVNIFILIKVLSFWEKY